MRYHVIIRHENKPDHLRRLIDQLANQRTDARPVDVTVFDNASRASLQVVELRVKQLPWVDLLKLERRHKAADLWQLWNRMLRAGSKSSAGLVVFLDATSQIAANFFDLLEAYWPSVAGPNTAALHLVADDRHQAGEFSETDLPLSQFVCAAPFFSAAGVLNNTDQPRLTLAQTIIGRGFRVFTPAKALIRVATPEQDQNVARVAPALKGAKAPTLRAPAKAIPPAPIFFSLASLPGRVDTLREIIADMLPQVDRIGVFLNGYPEVPDFLNHPRIVIARSQDHGDQGARGKLWFVREFRDHIHVIGDDDLKYPPDYAEKMAGAVEKYRRRAVVALHAYDLPRPFVSYAHAPKTHNFRSALDADCPVDIVGAGMMAFHGRTVSADILKAIRHPNMVDPYFALWARRHGVPLIAIARKENWLHQAVVYESIYDRVLRDDAVQTGVCRTIMATPRILVAIPTFNRPKMLMQLVERLGSMRGRRGVHVLAIDDGSTTSYRAVDAFAATVPWFTLQHHDRNFGKHGFWKTINEFFADAKLGRFDYLVALQDDVAVCADFLDVLFDHWDAIADARKGALNLFVDDLPRTTRGQWGAGAPVRRRFGDAEVDECGWFDGEWFMPRSTMAALNFMVNPIPPSRWHANPSRSAGDGEQLSIRLRRLGLKIYRPSHSLLDALPGGSHMHPERTWEFKAANFIGGTP